MKRALWAGLFAGVFLATEAAPVRADAAPWPFRNRGPKPSPPAEQAPQQSAIDPTSGLPSPPPREPDPPKRTGPFRSCGSGMGLGLAGIAAAWAMLWLGNRFAGRINRAAENRTR